MLTSLFVQQGLLASSKIYKKVWDKDHGSPLLHNTKLLADKLDKQLADVDVQYAMRYQSPSIETTLNDMLSRILMR